MLGGGENTNRTYILESDCHILTFKLFPQRKIPKQLRSGIYSALFQHTTIDFFAVLLGHFSGHFFCLGCTVLIFKAFEDTFFGTISYEITLRGFNEFS